MKFKLLKYFIFLVIPNYILPCCCDGVCNSNVKTNSSGNSSSFTTSNSEQNNEVKLENQVQTFIEKYIQLINSNWNMEKQLGYDRHRIIPVHFYKY